MDKARISVERVNADRVVFHIEALDPSILEHESRFRVMRYVAVHDSRAVNDTSVLFEHVLTWNGDRCELPVSLSRFGIYSYSGADIDVHVQALLHVDDALIFDTKINARFDLPLASRPAVNQNPHLVIEPNDIYSFFDNFQAVPQNAQIKIVAVGSILAIAGVAIAVVAAVNYNLILFLITVVVGVIVAIKFSHLVKGQLRAYIEADEGLRMQPVVRGEPLGLHELVAARATTDLDEIRLRIVAANFECGQYRRGHGTDVRTVSFRNPMRAVVLYDRTIPDIRAGDGIASHLRGDLVYFDELFELLYPPNMTSSSHGVDLRWEVQIMHDDFVDHELVGSNEVFDYRHFLLAPAEENADEQVEDNPPENAEEHAEVDQALW